MTDCIHEPEPQPGQRCDCQTCREARATAYDHISGECNRCAGRTATDHEGQFTCAKGDFDCCILDLWHGILVGEIDPSAIGKMQVVVIHEGRKAVTRRDRIPGDAPYDARHVRDHRIGATTLAQIEVPASKPTRRRSR